MTVTLINLPTRLHLQDSARGYVNNVVLFLCGVNMLPDHPDRPLCSAVMHCAYGTCILCRSHIVS